VIDTRIFIKTWFIRKLYVHIVMFGKFDHVTGAGLVRIKRIIYSILNKPDISFIDENIAIGGYCNIASLAKNNFKCILDMRQEYSLYVI